MAKKAIVVADLASDVLGDPNRAAWVDADHLRYVNDALRVIARFKPGAFASRYKWQLTASQFAHSIPAGYFLLLGPIYNMGAAGNTPGRTLTPITAAEIDTFDPTWRAATPAATLKHVVYDPDRNPTQFESYPPVHAATAVYVEAVLAKEHAEITNLANDDLPVADQYIPILADWSIYRAWARDSLETANPQKAAAHAVMAFNALGVKVQTDMLAPKVREYVKRQSGG